MGGVVTFYQFGRSRGATCASVEGRSPAVEEDSRADDSNAGRARRKPCCSLDPLPSPVWAPLGPCCGRPFAPPSDLATAPLKTVPWPPRASPVRPPIACPFAPLAICLVIPGLTEGLSGPLRRCSRLQAWWARCRRTRPACSSTASGCAKFKTFFESK
eukprot:1175820-Prorocentrum_minimum.AAC.6